MCHSLHRENGDEHFSNSCACKASERERLRASLDTVVCIYKCMYATCAPALWWLWNAKRDSALLMVVVVLFGELCCLQNSIDRYPLLESGQHTVRQDNIHIAPVVDMQLYIVSAALWRIDLLATKKTTTRNRRTDANFNCLWTRCRLRQRGKTRQ